MTYKVTLSNNEVLRIEEGKDCLNICTEARGDVDSYICKITTDGVTVWPNSGDACYCLTNNIPAGPQGE